MAVLLACMYASPLPSDSLMIRTDDLCGGSVKAGTISAFKSACMNETNRVGSDALINPGQRYTGVTVMHTPAGCLSLPPHEPTVVFCCWSEQHLDFSMSSHSHPTCEDTLHEHSLAPQLQGIKQQQQLQWQLRLGSPATGFTQV